MKRPLISVRERTPDAAELARQYQDNSGQDLTFVKGYSDKRRQVDDEARRGIDSKVDIPFRLHYVTVQKPNGRPDAQKATQFRAMGYRPLPYDEASNYGIEVPYHAERTPEGFIKVGDTVLYFTAAENAAKLEAQGRSAIDDATSADSTAAALHKQAGDMGALGQGIVTTSLEQRTEVTKGS